MTDDVLLAVLVWVTALRVFAPDMRHVVRLLLRAGVRIGMSEMLQGSSQMPTHMPTRMTTSAPPAPSRDQEV